MHDARQLVRHIASVTLCALLVVFGAATARADEPLESEEIVVPDAPEAPEQRRGPFYEVTSFEIVYLEAVPGAPPTGELIRTEVALEKVSNAFVRAGRGGEAASFRLDTPPASPTRYHASAINSINQQLVVELNRRGVGGVIVAPDDQDIDLQTAVDLRPAGRTALRLVVLLPTVGEVQTFASGDRIPEEESTNNPLHAGIIERSPVQQGDPLRPGEINEYVARLNRHPGRRVTAQLSPSREPGRIYLDYQVNEAKPILFYAQYSNTGPESTNTNQQRAGVVFYQLTGRDDILSLDYVTASLSSDTTAARVEYNTPLWFEQERLRTIVTGSYAKYTADRNLGFNAAYDGQQSSVRAEVSYNFFQRGELFADVFAGLTYENIEADNTTANINGKTGFMMPRGGIDIERHTDTMKFDGEIFVTSNIADWAATSHRELDRLGRLDPDFSFAFFRWDTELSFFLEPLIDPEGYRDLTTARSSALAHELYFSYAGQGSFNYRQIPQHQQIAGGLWTVRGYRQGVVAGDNVQLVTAEYRFHIPRIFSPRRPDELPILGEFAVAPQQAGGRPDWDLIFRAFFDYAKVTQNDRLPSEFNDTLRGYGVGLELAVKRWLSVRFDLGHSLNDARGGEIRDGSNRGYVVATLFY